MCSEAFRQSLAEDGVLAQPTLLATLVNNFDGMVYRCRDDAQWTMEFVSRGCYALTGYHEQELLFNKHVSYESITHAEDRARVREHIYQVLARHQRFDIEYRLVRADGAVIWVWERGLGVFSEEGTLLAIEGFITDVTARRLSQEMRQEAERRYRDIFEHATEGMFQTTLEGRYLNVNPALARIYGYASPAELIATLEDIAQNLYIDPQRRDEFLALMHRQDVVQEFESEIRRKNGEVIWISENVRAVRNCEGKLICFEGTVVDVTERKRYAAQLEYQATHDVLTGLPNRSLFADRMEQALRCAERDKRGVALAFVDLDQFKLINDTLGHEVGDKLLTEIAARLMECVRDADTVARLGGDEFVLICTHRHEEQEISRMMQRVLECISRPWLTPHGEFTIGCSIGISLFPRDGHNVESLLKSADSAMYKAKELGRNNFQFYTPELNRRAAERFELENALRRALEREEFLLHYQPRVDLASGNIVGLEALIRWQKPGEALIFPERFIPVAEETGLILAIGEWVLRTACAQAVAWQKRGLRPVVISINISPRQFQRECLITTIAAVLAETGLSPQWLEIELTESLIMQDAERFVSMLNALKALGVGIAVDDFGTGYSSLSYLKRFPVDQLKIDQSFVRDLTNDADDATLVGAIISLGHALGLRVVAEGVETKEQLDFLRESRCDEVQGFYLAHPTRAGDYEKF